MIVDAGIGGKNVYFPVGMRVLAVDDDPTCLKLLECLLKKCEYQVTITSQAKMALKMLREDRNRFDLVISDVHMPDMDGFKLLELVGLEMDLPVIMLSGNSDTKLVMKGITHGACDYLVKPVRIEELQNIWQHVIRRKKLDSKSLMSQDRTQQRNGDGNEEPALTGNTDQNGKLGRKRKDEEEEGEEYEHENEDPATQKKPRVVWSIELHRKFVAAVNQLGMEKAVPKRILDMMNVEGLTRENVASHLQKYRLYLKRICSVTSQQANMVDAFGGKESSYMRIGSLDGVEDFSMLAGHERLSNTSLSSYTPCTMLGRLNSSTGLNLQNLSPSLVQPSHSQNLCNSMNSLGKFQQVPYANQNASIFQGIPSSLELDQFQHGITSIGDLNSIEDSKVYSATSTFADTRVTVGCSSDVLTSASGNPLILQGNSHHSQGVGAYGTLSCLKEASVCSDSSIIGFNGPNFSDQDRCNENWQSAIQSLKYTSNSLQLTEPVNHGHLPPNVMRDNNSPTTPFSQNNPPINTVSTSLEDSRREVHCLEGLVGDVIRNFNQAQNCRWGEQHKQDYAYNSNGTYSNFNSSSAATGGISPLCQSIDQLNGICNRKMDLSLVDQSSFSASGGSLPLSSKIRYHEDYTSEQTKLQGGFVPNSNDSFDDLMNAVVKTEQDGKVLMDVGFGYDSYSFGSCI